MTLAVGLLVLDFHLPGCASLKEKRGRIGGVRDHVGRQTNVAVCESDFADSLQRAQWSFVVAAREARLVSQVLDAIERDVVQRVDAVVTRRQREMDA